MGAALIRKCWDIQEEKWAGHDYIEQESTDYTDQSDYYQNQCTKNIIPISRLSI
jgi:hypothetical protein